MSDDHAENETPAPDVAALSHRLSRCPPAFLRAPMLASKAGPGLTGEIHVGAVVSDLLIELGHPPLTSAEARLMIPRENETNAKLSRLALLCAHLLRDPVFITLTRDRSESVRDFFLERELKALAELGLEPQYFVFDAERREELVRLTLAKLELQPAGEKPAESRDRLQTLDSVERERVVAASRAAQKRAQEIREALARERAREAASKMSRE